MDEKKNYLETQDNSMEMTTSKEMLNAILDSSLDGIMSFDPVYDENGEIIDFLYTYSNQKGCEVVSKSYEEIIGERLSVIVSGNFLPLESLNGRSLFEIYKEVVVTGNSKEFEFYFEYNGIKEWFRVKAVKYKKGFVVTFTIITEEKDFEEQSLLASKGVMLESISHQWRQPLAQINSVLFKLKHSSKENKVLSQIDQIEKITSFLSSTIDDFHSIMFESAKKNIFFVDKCVKSVLDLFFETILDKKIKVINNIDENISINSYQNHLKHVIFSVVQNSIEAYTSDINTEKFIKFEAKKEFDKLILIIQDNAGGFDESNSLKIYERNFTTKDYGTGLGLYISQLIISKLFNGKIETINIDNGTLTQIEIKMDESL